MIRFKAHSSKLAASLNNIRHNFSKDKELLSGLASAQDQVIGKNVRTRFKLHKQFSHDSEATDSKASYYGVQAEQIIWRSIMTRVDRNNSTDTLIVIGTGDTKAMDRKDPIHLYNRPERTKKTEKHRIWRILEYGTIAHPITPRVREKPLKFFFKRAGVMLKSGLVRHPGTLGRHYFFKEGSTETNKIIYDEDVKIVQKFRLVFLRNLKRYIKSES